MNLDQRISQVKWAFFLVLLVIPVRLIWVQVAWRPELLEHPYNSRLAERVERRGRILDRNGEVLVQSKGDRRWSMHGPLTAHWTGYHSMRLGLAGGERWKDRLLRERRGYALSLSQEESKGRDVRLSMDLGVQRVLASHFRCRKGAGLVVDLETGQLLAALSYPDFDPNRVEVDWKSWQSRPDAPLLSRFALGLYPAGGLWSAWGDEFQALSRRTSTMDWAPPVQVENEWLVSPAQVASILLSLGEGPSLSQVRADLSYPRKLSPRLRRLAWKRDGQILHWAATARYKQQLVCWAIAMDPQVAVILLDEEVPSLPRLLDRARLVLQRVTY